MGTAHHAARDELQSGFKGALDDNTDYTLELENCIWRIHKSVIIGKSAHFAKICKSNSEEEAADGRIVLHDDNPWIFGRLLQFLYYGTYTYGYTSFIDKEPDNPSLRQVVLGGRGRVTAGLASAEEEADRQLSRATIDLRMYDIAEKYVVPSLRRYTLREFSTSKSTLSHIKLYELVVCYFPRQVDDDRELKKAIARRIARVYAPVRNSDDSAAKKIKKWLKEDNDLCHMVMDALVA